MDCSAGTDNEALAVVEPIVAEIVVVPADTPATSPVEGPTVATDGVLEVQWARVVTSCMLPSE
jgi:hypothetical protein